EPVYKHRSRVLTYVLFILATLGLLAMPSLAEAVVWAVFCYVYVDFYGGLLHYVLDNPTFLKQPVIGTGCLEFHCHHLLPHDIRSQPWLDVVGALNTLVVVRWAAIAIAYAWLGNARLLRSWMLFTAAGYGWAVMGQWAHRQAHTIDNRRSPF